MSGGYRTGRYIIAVDWVTRSPWMELMTDVREHHLLAQYVPPHILSSYYCVADFCRIVCSPERDQARYQLAPIIYGSLVPRHLPQVHDLLARTFWGGINGMLTILLPELFIDIRLQLPILSNILRRNAL